MQVYTFQIRVEQQPHFCPVTKQEQVWVPKHH